MSHVIDWHSHFLPPRFVERLRSRSIPPHVIRDKDGRDVRVNDRRGPGQVLRPTFVLAEARLRANDEAGVERQVLSLPGLDGEGLPPQEILELVQAYNNGLSEVVAAHSDRFSGLATLPPDDAEAAAQELERSILELGLIGAVIPVDAFLALPTAREATPILKVADRLGAHIFIHPGGWRGSRSGGQGQPADDGVPFRSAVIDLQGRIASAFATVAYSDLFAGFPSITVQLANLGGAIPFYVDRLDNVAHERGLPDPIAPLRRFYVDTGSQGTRSVELAASVLGADRVLFGTDDPVFSLPANIRAVNAARLDESNRRRILSENGRMILARIRGPGAGGVRNGTALSPNARR